MVSERKFQIRGKAEVFIFICAVTVVLSGSFIFAADELARYRVFTLQHISAEQGKKYLAELGIGTVSQLPTPNTLLVTAQPQELIKASAILELVDAEEQFVIKAIFPGSEAKNLPPNEQIAGEVGKISIGTFFEPPPRAATTKAIIDIHNDSVVAVAPVEQLEGIISAIEQLQNRAAGPVSRDPNESRVTRYEPRDANESDEFFNRLLDSLAEAEKIAAELGLEPAEPSAGAEQIEERALQAAEQPEEPNLPAGKGLQVKEDVEDEELVLRLETTLEEETMEIEQPSEGEETVTKRRSYQPGTIEYGDEILELDLPEKLNIVDLIDLVGKYLQLDHMFDPTKVKGDVTLKLQGPIKVKDLYPLLESVMKFKGFVMTRKINLVTIVPAAEALSIDPALLHDDVGEVKHGDVVVTRIFELRHIDTASAQNLLTGLKLSASITPIPGTGTLIITGYAYRMTRIEELLQMIDKPGEPKQFRFRQLKYTMAKTLAPKVKTLAEQLGTVAVTVVAPAAPAPPRGRKPPPRRAAPTPKTTQPTVYLDADERTNRILMIGIAEQLTVIDKLIDTLDVEQQDLRTLRLYEIQHVGAEEVKAKLQELGIIGGVGAVARPSVRAKTTKSAKPAAPGAAAEPLVEEPQVVIIDATNSLLVNATDEQHTQIATIIGYVDSETLERAIPYEIYALENQNPVDLAEVLQKLIQETVKDKEGKIQKVIKKGEDIVIVPDENTFSIIVYASKKNQEWIKKLIRTLDKRRPQVLIDVSLVEITQNDTFEYDLNIIGNMQDLVIDNIGLKGAVLPITTAIGNNLEGAWNLTDAEGNTNRVRGFYTENKIQALLTAIDSKGYGRVLARPKILVNDNEEGVISTVEKTYVEEVGAVVSKEGIATTTTKFIPYEAKIQLTITPHISEGDLLRLEVAMTREDFIKEEGSEAPPDYATSNIDTIVTVPDGSTIILGGLTKLKQTKGESKVPLLGDIPIVGALFRSAGKSNEERKLYIFVKANILRPDDTATGLGQLKRISEKSRVAFEKAEREFQKHQTFPGIEPEPIDPLHVLEEQ